MDLETRRLQQLLETTGYFPELILLKSSTTSTNDDVKEFAQKGLNDVLVASRIQTQGRGQRQRKWVSPDGNIYLSTLLQTQTPIDGRLALEIALNILEMPSLQQLNLQVKWPNDLYSTLGKWGGILIEPISSQQVVVGVGMNLSPLEESVDQEVTDLTSLGLNTTTSYIQLIHELYAAIQTAGQWFNFNSHNLGARFNHRAAFLNQNVTFEDMQDLHTGVFIGIEDDGSVKISTSQGIKTFYQGRLRQV